MKPTADTIAIVRMSRRGEPLLALAFFEHHGEPAQPHDEAEDAEPVGLAEEIELGAPMRHRDRKQGDQRDADRAG